MRDAGQRYVERLRDLAGAGVDALEREAKSRVLEHAGPWLGDDELTCVDLFLRAYRGSGEEHREVFIRAVSRLRLPFVQGWNEGEKIGHDTVALLDFVLIFFEGIGKDGSPARHLLKKLADSVVMSREEFNRQVDSPQAAALLGRLERLHVHHLEPDNAAQLHSLLRLWDRVCLGHGQPVDIGQCARLLEALVTVSPESVRTSHLFVFFQATKSLDAQERTRWLRSLFTLVGGRIEEAGLRQLTRDARECLFGQAAAIPQEEMRMFLHWLEWVWPVEDRAGFERLHSALDREIQDQLRAERSPASDNIVAFKRQMAA
ncbi:MAG: hypothetical protein HQL99_05145 [Magnetococcales bacterium]|nr:hypothetical protein [Magnetococcales bacterium]